jgi:hypothetical protein
MKQLPVSNKSFSRPPGIVEQLICAETGLLATPDCNVVSEYFTQWNTPQEVCSGQHLEEWQDISSARTGQHIGSENRGAEGVR